MVSSCPAIGCNPSQKINYSSKKNGLLYSLSVLSASNDKETKRRNKFTAGLIAAVPIVDSAIEGGFKALQTNSFAKAVGHFAKRLGIWALSLGFFDLIFSGIDKITNKSKTLKEIKEKQPDFKLLMDFGVLFTTYRLASEGAKKAIKYIPESIKNAGLAKKADFTKTLDASKFAQKVFNPLLDNTKAFLTKHDKLAKAIIPAMPYIVPAMVLGVAIKACVSDPAKLNKKIKENYLELKGMQAAKEDIEGQD